MFIAIVSRIERTIFHQIKFNSSFAFERISFRHTRPERKSFRPRTYFLVLTHVTPLSWFSEQLFKKISFSTRLDREFAFFGQFCSLGYASFRKYCPHLQTLSFEPWCEIYYFTLSSKLKTTITRNHVTEFQKEKRGQTEGFRRV